MNSKGTEGGGPTIWTNLILIGKLEVTRIAATIYVNHSGLDKQTGKLHLVMVVMVVFQRRGRKFSSTLVGGRLKPHQNQRYFKYFG